MRIKNFKISIIYKLILIIFGIFSLICTTGFLDNQINLKIFQMFTTISNILCVVYFIIDFIYLLKNKRTFMPLLKGMITMSITVTFLVAHFMLKMSFSFNSFSGFSLLGLHYILPIMTIIDFILFDEKGLIKKNYPFIWIIIPYIYFLVAILYAKVGNGLGMGNSKYPYPFIDIDKLGLSKVIVTIIIMTIGFILIGYFYYFVDKLLKHHEK